MSVDAIRAEFLRRIPTEYPRHMLCYFAGHAEQGRDLPFAANLFDALDIVETAVPGYANEMIARIAAIEGTGEDQYETILSILAEIYVSAGLCHEADDEDGIPQFTHEPSLGRQKNPEFEVCVGGQWCAVEVKNPRLIQHGRMRAREDWQVGVRLPLDRMPFENATLPRDNPVKDFLVSAEEKFADYENYRTESIRILAILWDDFCNEPIAALTSPVSGLLTTESFHRNEQGNAVRYPHIDGIVIIRHQHQLMRSTRCEPLVNGLTSAFQYHHDGFPPKIFIRGHGGRVPSPELMRALNARPVEECHGAEFHPTEVIMWVDY
jgi:hypothetical protein